MLLKIDAPGIAELIQQLVDLSMDGRIEEKNQKAYLEAARTLQQRMLPTLYATFNDGTAVVEELNRDIRDANQAVKSAADSLAATEKVFKVVGEVVDGIAKVVKVAAKVAAIV